MSDSSMEYLTYKAKKSLGYYIGHLFRYFTCYVKALYLYRDTPPCITVYGSARIKPDHPFYQIGVELGAKIASRGLAVMTGAGPGLMESVNKGAHDNNGQSMGCNIYLPFEQMANPFVNSPMVCRYFC